MRHSRFGSGGNRLGEELMAHAFEFDESILDAAEKLFSEIGYDSTTLRMVSEVAGEGVDLRTHEGRVKQQLYRQVFARLYNIEMEQIQTAIRTNPKTIAGIHAAVDAFVDFIVDHPEYPALWRHRGLGDAADIQLSPQDYLSPLIVLLTSTRWEGVSADLDLRLLSWFVIWSSGAFAHDGFVDEAGRRVFPNNPQALHRFRNQLHEVLEALNRTGESR
ncbi:TetR/AcrR family transcriptional regulator [Actinomadura sp. 3N508]|uniref:TetR/AcrR family transcriptional regulator n=1 Tax=Actinomadura sp. 3N508 TaxID=3375153 RepID=UPI0037B2A15C